MGVGPKCLEKGDSVFILRGLNSPLILRKVEEEGQRGAGSKTESRVVGVAYVHGRGIRQGSAGGSGNSLISQNNPHIVLVCYSDGPGV